MTTAKPRSGWRGAAARPGSVLTAVLALLVQLPAVVAQSTGPAVFVGNSGNLEGSVTAFRVEPDGTLTQANRVITGWRPDMTYPCPGCNPSSISLTPNGAHLATGHTASSEAPEQITFFSVAADASLTQIAQFILPDSPLDITWLTDDLIAVNRINAVPNEVAVYRFDPDAPGTPSLTEVDVVTVGTFSTRMAIHPSRHYVYISDSGTQCTLRAFRLEPDGTLLLIDQEYTGSYTLGLGVTPDGTKLYACAGIYNLIHGYHIDPDGLLTRMSGSPFSAVGASPKLARGSADSQWLLIGHGTDSTVRSAAIDPATGALWYPGFLFDVGLQGTLGDVQILGDLFFVTDTMQAVDGLMGIYSFTLNEDGSFTQHGPITWTGGIAPTAIATWLPPRVPGDLNCDGAVNGFDIHPFVLALTAPQRYASEYPDCDIQLADVNSDDAVNALDINPFVHLITGG